MSFQNGSPYLRSPALKETLSSQKKGLFLTTQELAGELAHKSAFLKL